MSIRDLFHKNKQAIKVSKYLKKSAPGTLGDGIESEAHLSESLIKRDDFTPPIDYLNPESFVKFGSAEQYYKDAFDYIANYYPYDGSNFETEKFFNDLNPLEKYLLNEKYPHSTGFITLGSTYGNVTSSAGGYFNVDVPEYVQIKGGPHSGTIYNEPSSRTSNLTFGGVSGSTIEFFFKKNQLIDHNIQSQKQVIFDLWNGVATGESDYGRLRVELFSGSEDRFRVTMLSGTNGFSAVEVPSTGGITIASGSWQQYSFSFNTSGSTPSLDFFVNGTCIQTDILGTGQVGEVTGTMVGNIGGLRTNIVGGTGVTEGAGKLSGSVDEFRFWKSQRTQEDIGRYWFDRVYGGANKYDANKSLGVYLRFNEGVTTTASVDSVVLDYSGRLSNGNFVGYSTESRNTGSAINDLDITSVSEPGDPIIRTDNPLYQAARTEMISSGSYYDASNSSRLTNHLPEWILDLEQKGDNELASLSQIIATYFDTLHNQLEYIAKLKHTQYISGSLTGSLNEFTHNDRLVESYGLAAPELFENVGPLQQFLQRDEQIDFDQQLVEIKNSIYKNIYNNLSYILKAKGNEKSIRNLIRCFGVGEEIISLNTYLDNEDLELESNYKTDVSSKKYADFTGLVNQYDFESTVYQYPSGSTTVGLITGSNDKLDEYAFTLQSEVVFPDLSLADTLDYMYIGRVSSSLFGFHTPNHDSQTSTDTTWASPDYGLKLYAVKLPGDYPDNYGSNYRVKDAYFIVKDADDVTLLTSSIYSDVYNDKNWTLALSLRPEKYPFCNEVLGTEPEPAGPYILTLCGVNYDAGIQKNIFTETASISYTSGSAMLNEAKRIYIGADRTNHTGALVHGSDIRVGNCRYWTDYLDSSSIDLHAKEVDSAGRMRPYTNAFVLQQTGSGVFIPRTQTLAMNWEFHDITGSDASGQFFVSDISSGSVSGSSYVADYQRDPLSGINLRYHTGRGDFFSGSSPARKQYVYASKLQGPEYVSGEDMVRVMTTDDKTFEPYTRPKGFFFAVEKSMYHSISNRILHLFASIDEFNNLIGEPVNKYRPNYKSMEKMREIFFRNVENERLDLQKYVDYYKWLDFSMNEMIVQLFPASARFAKDVRTVVESHVLERPKYRWIYPRLIQRVLSSRPITNNGLLPDGAIHNTCPDTPGWKFNHAPLDSDENKNCFWWKSAPRDTAPLYVSAGTLATRNAVLNAAKAELTGSQVVCFSADMSIPIVGGINQYVNKRRNFKGVTFHTFEVTEHCTDELIPNQKTQFIFTAEQDGVSSKGNLKTPFTAISSSVVQGYRSGLISSGLTGVDLVNLHEDSLFPYRHSVPMQGPFTREHVGGIQARHVSPFATERKESHIMNIASGTGSITRLGPGSTPIGQYYRDYAAKSILNIKNIKTNTTASADGGVNIIGNYVKNYSVVQGTDQAATNIDFAFNPDNFSYSEPTAFLTPPDRRAAGQTGSADYPNPRQIPTRRINETIFVDRFSAPGDKNVSKQQFSDVLSGQYAPNNALPFRNEMVRRPGNLANRQLGVPLGAGAGYSGYLRLYTGWGGFQQSIVPELEDANAVASPGADALQHFNNGGAPTTVASDPAGFPNIDNVMQGGLNGADVRLAALHKTQRNGRERIEISSNLISPNTYYTASVYDNAYVTRPIPTADRSTWTAYISGSGNETLYTEYIDLYSRYPKNITFQTQSINAEAALGVWTHSVFNNTAGKTQFLWDKGFGYQIWNQIAVGQTHNGRYYTLNNIYEFPAIKKYSRNTANQIELGQPLASRSIADRAANIVISDFSRQYVEPPITSRYKPLLHQIKTPLGTPSETQKSKIVDANMDYSYGNYLMGFANRNINALIGPQGNRKYAHNLIKRPYEILRDHDVNGVRQDVDGVNLIKLFSYKETIYPKEIYTYLSGTRARLAYTSSFWRNDNTIVSTDVSAITSYIGLNSEANQKTFVNQYPRNDEGFITSQGYRVQAGEQTPFNSLDASYPMDVGAGTASMWPLDSYYFSNCKDSLVTILTGSTPVVMADAATMPCGELMMTHYGTVNDGLSNASFANGTASYQTSSINSAQYVYNIPVTSGSCSSVGAVAAQASITASYAEDQGITAATANLLFGTDANDGNTNTETFQIEDTKTRIMLYKFDNTVEGTTFDSAVNEYTIGTKVGAAGQLSTTEVRDALYNALVDSTSTPADPLEATAAKNGSLGIDLTATVLGTSMNSKTVLYSDDGSSTTQVAVTSWAGGANYTYNSKTLLIDDDTHGTVTYVFDVATAPGASTSGIIGTSGPASAAQVAGAIRQTINLSQGVGDITVTAGTVVGSTVPLTADNAGVAMNGEPIAGSAEADGGIVAADFAGGSAAGSVCISAPEVRSPGSAYTRPPWTAGSQRYHVDGISKGSSLSPVYPFYNSYNDFITDARLKGQNYTIVPEYRISEHVGQFETNGSVISLISGALEITGANDTNYDGSNPEFYQRYSITDTIEFLENFMPDDKANRNFIFNNYPRHFQMESDAILKLLPYDGFYPVNRTLEVAALFSQSYAPSAVYAGINSTGSAAQRSLLRPFFAPGIMYNSIKSGLAVDYPVRRVGKNSTQFLSASASDPLFGCLSGSLTSVTTTGEIPGSRRRATEGGNTDFSFNTNADVGSFFWADRLPFETILDPAAKLGFKKSLEDGIVLSDINGFMALDVSGAIQSNIADDSIYKKAVSNFLANVPRFFLKEKTNAYGSTGNMTKFVSQFGGGDSKGDTASEEPRTVAVSPTGAYIMEIGLLKTDNINMYSNPYAFGIPTATGSSDWAGLAANQLPEQQAWPNHRGEFAPFTPPYYYGPSVVRVLFKPNGGKSEYTLDEIINNTRGEIFVQYLNENGYYYDWTSGSYIDSSGVAATTVRSPAYEWNRAWQNRMDIDASVVVNNRFPVDNGATYKPLNPNKWVIMPKWECPVLDFPKRQGALSSWNFSSSVTPTQYTASTDGMWHQYGIQPQKDEGIYMFIRNVHVGDFDLVNIGASDGTVEQKYVEKVPKFILENSQLEVLSLADLCGFDSSDIIDKGFDPQKAKRLGELAENEEKTLSEAILAMPFYTDKDGTPRAITLRAPANKLGPQIKEFRKKFTKYSLPPPLALKLRSMLPPGYPEIADEILPFGTDVYDEVLRGEKMITTPVVYLMEHIVSLDKQDLADMWQGIMPDISTRFNQSLSSIDHYMPGDNVEENPTVFPEVLKAQLELGVTRDGHPRYDLLDVVQSPDVHGMHPNIRWLVFKVKERGIVNYSQMIREEVDGRNALSYENVRGYFSTLGLTEAQINALDNMKDDYTKSIYLINHAVMDPTHNWPYDYCSLVELAKINSNLGFRPDLERESTTDSGILEGSLVGQGAVGTDGIELETNPLIDGLNFNQGDN